MRIHRSLALLLAACTIDTNLVGGDGVKVGFDSGPADTAPADTGEDVEAPPPEECNGVDDDGDGAIDEDFPDANANGRADCLDVECPDVDAPPAAEVATVEACDGTTVCPDPWNIVVEWQYGSGVGYGATNITATGHLTDDDGDGVLGSAGDIPEIVYSDWRERSSEVVTVLAGDGSGVVWEVSGFGSYRAVAMADVDGDGWTEVLGFTADDRVVALDDAGAPVWISDVFDFTWGEQIAVADLDGDGLPEVIADEALLNGEDGSTVATLSTAQMYRSPTPGDLNLDGMQEIVLGPDVYDATGTLLWSAAVPPTSDTFAALVQADADPEGEVAFVSDLGYQLYDTDGTLLVEVALPSGQPFAFPGPPCVADFDGDGTPELAVATYDNLSVIELDGTVVWSAPTRDWGPTGCSGFDFDFDGAAEVLTHDIYAVYLLDGRTGTERWSWRPGYGITNGQGSEYSYVADVDNDGVAEIVASTNNDSTLGVIVFGQADGDWPAAGPTWGVQDFSESNLEDDGSIPSTPTPPWDEGVFRARPTRANSKADLFVDIGAVCVADCDYGPVEVLVQVTNQGARDVPAGAALEVYAVDDAGDRLVATVTLPELPAGTRIEATTVPLTLADAGTRGLAALVDPAGTVTECDETNNRGEWLDVFCP